MAGQIISICFALCVERSDVNLFLLRGTQECLTQAKSSTVLARSSLGPLCIDGGGRERESYNKTRELKQSRQDSNLLLFFSFFSCFEKEMGEGGRISSPTLPSRPWN